MTQARAIIAAVAALALALLLAIGWFQWRAAKDAKARAVVAEQGQELAEQTTGIIERTVRTEVVVRQETERQVDVVQSVTLVSSAFCALERVGSLPDPGIESASVGGKLA